MAEPDDWIRASVRGKRFADVGGLWGTVNEKVTVALEAGAEEAVLIDIVEPGAALWRRFRTRCAKRGFTNYRCVHADVRDLGRIGRVGRFDVVYCSGVLYHAPNPWAVLEGLGLLTSDRLILASAVVPQRIDGEPGPPLSLEAGAALLVPAMTVAQKAVATEFFRIAGADEMAGLETPADWSRGCFEHWWWLFTAEHIAGLLDVAGFEVLERAGFWSGRAEAFLAKRK